MSHPAKKRKPPATPVALAKLRWKGRNATDRIAETAAARAARWPICRQCGLTEARGQHDTDRVFKADGHYFDPMPKEK